jgi:hypothetical protein
MPGLDWLDTLPGAYARNVSRMVAGALLDIGDNERGIEERTVLVHRLRDVVVGIDSTGIFCCLTVVDTEGAQWSLYHDGSVHDDEDREVGRHTLKTSPERSVA